MKLHIKGRELPGDRCGPGPDAPGGHSGLRVGVQRRGDAMQVLDPVGGDADTAEWTIDCVARETGHGVDVTGPYVQGRPGQRFIYLSWLSDQGPGPLGMFRRGKIRLDEIPEPVLRHAIAGGAIEVEVRLTDVKGNPACATFGPPALTWRVASED
jgi:hypothetical protein